MNSADMTPEILPPSGPATHATGDGATGDGGSGADGSVSVDTVAPGGKAPRRRRRWWLWGVGAVLALGAVLGAVFIPTSYVLIQPGAVRPVAERIEVDGATVYEDDGDVLFTTVFVDPATLFGLLRGSLDDAIEVRTQDEVYGSVGRDESREINRAQMDLSKLIANQQALDFLGYETSFTADGAHVVEVSEGSLAESVIEAGDVIVAVDGAEVAVPADLRTELATRSPGESVTVSIERPTGSTGETAGSGVGQTKSLDLQATLGASKDDNGIEQAVLGVSVEPWNPRIESEVTVEIDSGTVTGPSAGLAWSLAVIDTLTPGSLTGDRDVAVTGEILADGSVGVVGGVAQKVATVARSGVEVFLYPAGTPAEEQDEMRRIAGDDIELVPVATLAEAVEFLAPEGLSRPG